MMWGGGDGSAEARGGDASGQAVDRAPAGAAAGAMGAAGVNGVSGDEQIYGQQPGQPYTTQQDGLDRPFPGQEGLSEPNGEGFGQEEVMEDPWIDEKSGGWFGGDKGGEGGGDGGGDWGDFGDWS